MAKPGRSSTHDTWRPGGGPPENDDRPGDRSKRRHRSRSPSEERRRSPPRHPRKKKGPVDTYIPGESSSRDRPDRSSRGGGGGRGRSRDRDRSREPRRSASPRRRSPSPRRSRERPPRERDAPSSKYSSTKPELPSKSPKRPRSISPPPKTSKRSRRDSRSPRRRSPEHRSSHKYRSRRSKSRSRSRSRRRSPYESSRKSRKESPPPRFREGIVQSEVSRPSHRSISPGGTDSAIPRGPRRRSPPRSDKYNRPYSPARDRDRDRGYSPRRRSPPPFGKGKTDKRPRRRKSPRRPREYSPDNRISRSPSARRDSTGSISDAISHLANKRNNDKKSVVSKSRDDPPPREKDIPPSPRDIDMADEVGTHPPKGDRGRSLSPYSKRLSMSGAGPRGDDKEREREPYRSSRPGGPPPPSYPKGPRDREFDRGRGGAINARARRRRNRLRPGETYNDAPRSPRGRGNGIPTGPKGYHSKDDAERPSSSSSTHSDDDARREGSLGIQDYEMDVKEGEELPEEHEAPPKETEEIAMVPPGSPTPPPPPPPPTDPQAERDAALMPPPNAPRGPRGDLFDGMPKPAPIDTSKGKVRFSLSGTGGGRGKLPTGPRNQDLGMIRRKPHGGTASNNVPVAPRGRGMPIPTGPASSKPSTNFGHSEPPPPKEKKKKDPVYPRVVMVRGSPFERIGQVGEGTYGKVYKAKNRASNELVALKRVRMSSEKDGFPVTAAREIKILQSLGKNCENLVHLLDTMVELNEFYMIFDYADHDLTGILHHPTYRLEPANIKDLAKQLFEGLAYIHHKGILHRDIKGSNILLNNSGLLKIADFGLAREYKKLKNNENYTNRVITLWYRPVEILLGETLYKTEPDVWSSGCVFMELFTRKAIFQGKDEIGQLDTIWSVLGTPKVSSWPGWRQTPWYSMLRPEVIHPPVFHEKFKDSVPADALALASRIFAYDPAKRPSAEEVLSDPYFTNEPLPERTTAISDLQGDWHEYESKSRRKREAQLQREKEKAALQAKIRQ